MNNTEFERRYGRGMRPPARRMLINELLTLRACCSVWRQVLRRLHGTKKDTSPAKKIQS